jgi:hypothetical protein
MALKRIVGSAVRHPLATTALVAGVAKGTISVVQRLFRGDDPWSSTDQVTSTATTAGAATEPATGPPTEPEVVLPRPEERDLPEPVVIYAEDEEPDTVIDYEGHVDLEEELVWTSESSAPPTAE